MNTKIFFGIIAIIIGIIIRFKLLKYLRKVYTKPTDKSSKLSAIDTAIPSVKKALKAKEKLREQAEKKEKYQSNNNLEKPMSRVPQGQFLVKKWISFDLGLGIPDTYDVWKNPSENWQLKFSGLQDESQVIIRFDQLKNFSQKKYQIDWHCVTGWSALDIELTGIPFSEILTHVRPKNNWTQLYQISADGYTANVYREDAEKSGCFLAIGDSEGNLIPKEHGGIRVVFPTLYGWKSAKFLSEVVFLDDSADFRGFWENNGCHFRGRIEANERWQKKSHTIWTILCAYVNAYNLFGNDFYEKVLYYGAMVFAFWIKLKQRILGK